MTKEELTIAVENAKVNTREALQTVFNELNSGQQKKLLKNETIKTLFDLYGVEYTE